MEWNASLYAQSHSFVWRGGQDLIALLAPQAGERILDVGCGTGQLTAALAAGGARVSGLDSSATMLEQARTAYPEIPFIHADLPQFETDTPFDGLFSNAALHWIQPAEMAVRRMHDALRTGGRLVVELGGTGNVASVLDAAAELLGGGMKKPWYFPSVGEYAKLLEKHGFEVLFALLFDRLTPLEGGSAGLGDWLQVFGAPLGDGDGEWRASLFAHIEERLKPRLYDAARGQWSLDYRRLRVVARRID